MNQTFQSYVGEKEDNLKQTDSLEWIWLLKATYEIEVCLGQTDSLEWIKLFKVTYEIEVCLGQTDSLERIKLFKVTYEIEVCLGQTDSLEWIKLFKVTYEIEVCLGQTDSLEWIKLFKVTYEIEVCLGQTDSLEWFDLNHMIIINIFFLNTHYKLYTVYSLYIHNICVVVIYIVLFTHHRYILSAFIEKTLYATVSKQHNGSEKNYFKPNPTTACYPAPLN